MKKGGRVQKPLQRTPVRRSGRERRQFDVEKAYDATLYMKQTTPLSAGKAGSSAVKSAASKQPSADASSQLGFLAIIYSSVMGRIAALMKSRSAAPAKKGGSKKQRKAKAAKAR
jgi:hypothetical protein